MEESKLLSLINDGAHLLFTGPPGTGKTRTAKILAKDSSKKIFLLDGNISSDFLETLIIEEEEPLIFIDEIHALNKKCQTMLLPVLEDGTLLTKYMTVVTPAVFIGATTDAWKLFLPLRNRFFEVKFDLLSNEEMRHAIHNKFPDINLDSNSERLIVELSQGIPRNMVQTIRSILSIYSIVNEDTIEMYKQDRGIKNNLNITQQEILLALREKPYSLTGLSNRLILNKNEVELNESYLIKNKLVQISSRGRELTRKGAELL